MILLHSTTTGALRKMGVLGLGEDEGGADAAMAIPMNTIVSITC